MKRLLIKIKFIKVFVCIVYLESWELEVVLYNVWWMWVKINKFLESVFFKVINF